jgi:LysM repeat protein
LEQKHKKVIHNKAIWSLFAVLIMYPLLTHASILQASPLKDFFYSPKQDTPSDASSTEHNSQTASILQASTNLDPNPAPGDTDLNIIEDKALVAESGVAGGFVEINNRKSDQIAVYEVKEGDTISQIAHMFDVSVNTIKWANNLDRPIKKGDSLVILPTTGIKHTVKAGGTIADIAKKYNADAKEIALFNGISIDTALVTGQEIIVPNVDLVVEEPKKSTKPTSKASGKTSIASTNMSSGSSDWLIKPIRAGRKTQGIHGHNGIDFGAPNGTPIYAAAGGTVIIAKNDDGWNGGYGNYVVIKHPNGVQTLYAHMTTVLTSVGSQVSQGKEIGTVGNTGKSTGNHLHFEVRGAKNPF